MSSVRWNGWHCSNSGRIDLSSPTGIGPRAGARSDFYGRGHPDSPQAPVGRRRKSRGRPQPHRHESLAETDRSVPHAPDASDEAALAICAAPRATPSTLALSSSGRWGSALGCVPPGAPCCSGPRPHWWRRWVMNELKARGVADMLIAVVDGLKGFPKAIEAVYPEAAVQTCIVHLIRRSLAYALVPGAPGGWRPRSRRSTKRRRRPAAGAVLNAFEAGLGGASEVDPIGWTGMASQYLITTQAKCNLSSRSGIGGVRSAT